MIRPREEIALMEGYHSPQIDVDVRLNTNESPEPPPAAWTAARSKIDSSMNSVRRPARLRRDPVRRLSSTRTSARSWSCSARWLPMKPAPPVIRTFMGP